MFKKIKPNIKRLWIIIQQIFLPWNAFISSSSKIIDHDELRMDGSQSGGSSLLWIPIFFDMFKIQECSSWFILFFKLTSDSAINNNFSSFPSCLVLVFGISNIEFRLMCVSTLGFFLLFTFLYIYSFIFAIYTAVNWFLDMGFQFGSLKSSYISPV